MEKIVSLLKILAKKRYFINNPKKVELLIFGNTLKYFKIKKNIFILNDQINLGLLIKSILKSIINGDFVFKNLNELYFCEVIKVLSPKIALGNEINLNIFKFKKLFPNKIAIAYQCVHWNKLLEGSLRERLNYKNLVCDYFFVYDKDSQKILNFIKTKFIVSGSVRNNEILRKKRKHKKYDVMFISEYRDKEKINEFLKKKQSKVYRILATETLLFQSFILKALNNLCKKNNLKICVALAGNRLEKKQSVNIENEKKFLNDNISNFDTETISSYELAEKSKMVITFMSTLGKELLAKKHKVMFVLYSKYKSINQKYLPNKNGKYWYKGKLENLLEQKILQLLKLEEKKWTSYLKKNNLSYEYDKGNSKLKNLIIKLLKQN